MSSAPYFLPISSRGASLRWPALFQAWLPILLFAFLIALESTTAFGSNRTSVPLHRIMHLVFGSSLGSYIDNHWTYIHHIIRKTGHFTGFGMLSLLCYRGFRQTLRNAVSRLNTAAVNHTLAITIAFLIASADELHQCFLPNRTGCFSDVLLDTAGAATAQLAVLVILHIASQLSASQLSKAALQEIAMWQPQTVS